MSKINIQYKRGTEWNRKKKHENLNLFLHEILMRVAKCVIKEKKKGHRVKYGQILNTQAQEKQRREEREISNNDGREKIMRVNEQ